MPRSIALLVEAREPGALNLSRAFRVAGHQVTILNRGPHRVEGDAEILELSRAHRVIDLYPADRWRDDRAFFVLNGAGVKAARLGLGDLARGVLLRRFDRQLAKPIQARVAAAVRDCGADVVWGFWGIGQMPEQRALQLAQTPAALVHQFQTYPQTDDAAGHARASPLEQVVLGRLDARASASARMEQWVNDQLRPVRGLDQVLPEAWGSWVCARRRLPRLSEGDGVPHVVHMGVPPSKPGTYDDVGPDLAALAREGLRVHAREGFDHLAGVENFAPMGLRALLDGKVSEFMSQFDAAVMLYRARPGLERFAGNFPARVLSGISAGIPLALPRGLFGAVQEFVAQHGNGFVYDSPADLAAKLRDDEAMDKARKLALALEREHRLERFLNRYDQFLDRALKPLPEAAEKPSGASATLK